MWETSEMIQRVIGEATSALLTWLDEGWIRAEGPWNVDRAHVEVNRDWYAPYWTVTFTIDRPPWFGDSVCVEVEEFGYHRMEANIDSISFMDDNILCCHKEERVPEGHWRRRN